MKNTSLVINVVLAIAVATLYVLHFTSKPNTSDENGEPTNTQNEVFAGEGVAVAWVNMDSVLVNYDMYFDMQKSLEDKEKNMESDMNMRARDLEKQMIDLQDRFQKTLITRSQAQQKQQELAEKEQELYRYWEELRMQYTEEQQVMLRRIYQSIYDYLKEYNKDKGFHVILSSSFGGPVLYGSKSIEITDEVLKGLNTDYIKSSTGKN